MAFNDPQSVTISGQATSLPRTSSGINSGAFTAADGAAGLVVSHAYGKRTRRTLRLNHSKIAADPLTSANVQYSMSAYLVVDTPNVGYSVAEAKAIVDALVGYLSASTGAKVSQLLGGEN